MLKTRAPGGGRKSLNPSEKTTSRNVTLLPSQVAAMEKLGGGNLSAGIRKAIESMKPETIPVKFDATDLPEWAQKDADVVERCKTDIAFRGDVYDAQTAQRQRQLTIETRRLAEQIRNR